MSYIKMYNALELLGGYHKKSLKRDHSSNEIKYYALYVPFTIPFGIQDLMPIPKEDFEMKYKEIKNIELIAMKESICKIQNKPPYGTIIINGFTNSRFIYVGGDDLITRL